MRRICIFGAGAVGGELAVRLAQGGVDPSVIARGELLRAIRAGGITVRFHNGTTSRCVPEIASDDPRDLGPQDAVIVAVKAPALPSVAAVLGPLLGPDTLVVFVINGLPWWYALGDAGPLAPATLSGLDPHGAMRAAIRPDCVIGGTISTACTMVEPAVIRSEHAVTKLVLGEIDGRTGGRLRGLAHTFEAGGLRCEITSDMRAEVWRKLMTNLACGPTCLLTRRSMRDSFADPVVRAAAERLVSEGMAIAEAALGHPLGGEAGDRVAQLAETDHKPSILQDFEAGRPLEFDALFGRPLYPARCAKIETPTLDLLTALAAQAVAMGAGRRAPHRE